MIAEAKCTASCNAPPIKGADLAHATKDYVIRACYRHTPAMPVPWQRDKCVYNHYTRCESASGRRWVRRQCVSALPELSLDINSPWIE